MHLATMMAVNANMRDLALPLVDNSEVAFIQIFGRLMGMK
jgi:hypothetical protein